MPKKKSFQKSQKFEGYQNLLSEVRSILDKGLRKTYQAVDNIRVQTYWQVGERIVREELKHKDRAEYGKRVIEYLAKDLGFSRRLIFEVVEFYKVYPIVHTLCAQLSWSHYGLIVRLKSKEEREFYETQTIKNGWYVRELEKRIRRKEYEKAKKIGRLDLKIPKKLPNPGEVFRGMYNFDFAELEAEHTERQLENLLVSSIRKTLLELGHGFFFGGQQISLHIAKQYHKIDLLFYHRDLQCIVIVELKKEKFKAEHIGQMNKYLTYFRENDKRSWERDPIGLIICSSKNDEEVHYAIGKLQEDIFVAEYQTKLPLERDIAKRLKKLRE